MRVAIQVPASPGASNRTANMRAIRRRDTSPERRLRSELHRRGLRFRVDFPIGVGNGRAPRADVAFTRHCLAVFVDGCFWHGCPEHSEIPRRNASYWGPKIARNAERDREQEDRLKAAGWRVLRFWEHEEVFAVATRVEEHLRTT